MKFSVRRKLMVLIISLVILGFLVGLSLCAAFANRYYVSVKQKEMRDAYSSITQMYRDYFGSEFYYTIPRDNYKELSRICEANGFSMLIQSPAGVTTFSYGNSDILQSRLINLIFSGFDQTNSRIIENGGNYIIQTVIGENKTIDYLEMWGFLYDGSSFIYRCSYSGIQNSINLTLRFYFIICLIIYSIFAVITMVIMYSFTETIKGLAAVSKKVSEGEFESTYESKKKRNDELGIIGANISEMSHKLEKTISELKTSNLNLQNELKAKEKLEEQRKKYMSDVSHELKTPIALISGYAEGLKEGISDNPEDREYYCDVIIDEANKMNTLVKRLSTLNQLEQGKSAVNLERFDVVRVIDGFLNNMSIIIEENEANIYFNNKDVAYVWCDEFLLEEVLVNYFNNALHHMDDNKIIRINVEKNDNIIRMTVFNSGKPIPEEELDKIWGKFYKVDQARTREYGGSGLGLSIVKAISDSLGKECGVYNLSDGVAFYLEMESASINHEEGQEGVKAEKPEHTSKLNLSDLPIWKSIVKKVEKGKESASNK